MDNHLQLPDLTANWLLRGLASVGITGPLERSRSAKLTMWHDEQVARAYHDGAGNDPQNGDWKKISANANEVWDADGKTLRDRAKYLASSSEYGARARQVLVDAVIGTGITTQCQVQFSTDNITNQRQNTKLEDIKKRWAETAFIGPDMSLYDGQALWLSSIITAGENLVYRRYIPNRKVRGTGFGVRTPELPLVYEIIDAARLTSIRTEAASGNTIVDGIEYDENWSPVAYHVEDGGYRYKVTRIPAENIAHSYRVDSPGQRRGITWFAPVIPSLYLLKDIIRYKVIQYKVQSAISALVSDGDGPSGGAAMPSLPTPSGVSKTTDSNAQKQFLTPGLIHKVGKGKVTPFMPSPSGDLDPMVKLLLRGIGVGMGLSYERQSGDYKEVSFAGGRLTENAQKDRIDPIHAWQNRTIELPMHVDFIDIASAYGLVPRLPRRADPYAVRFSKPRFRRGVNPLQEVNAAAKAIESRLSNYQQEADHYGLDAIENFHELAKQKDVGDTLGLDISTVLGITDDNAGENE